MAAVVEVEWLRIPDVAKLLQISERSVIRLTKRPRGALLCARIGGLTRIRRSALDTWLKAVERKSA